MREDRTSCARLTGRWARSAALAAAIWLTATSEFTPGGWAATPIPPAYVESGRLLDFYAILGVSRDASTEEITRAYRRLAQSLHPDRLPHLSAPEILKREATLIRANRAYGVLKRKAERKTYDAHLGLKESVRPFVFQDFSSQPPPKKAATPPQPETILHPKPIAKGPPPMKPVPRAEIPNFERVAARLADALALPQAQRFKAIARLKPEVETLSSDEQARLTSRALDYLQGRKAYSETAACSRLYAEI